MNIFLKMVMSTLSVSLLTAVVHAAEPDFAGTWKTIDDKTGFSRADVLVTKNNDGSYSGKIITIRPLPDKPLVEICVKCRGSLKDRPLVGLEIVSGFKKNPKMSSEFIDGQVLDPLSGNVYSGKAKLNPRGNRVSLRGYMGVSMLGRSTTWVRIN